MEPDASPHDVPALELSALEVLTTTRSVRKRLDFDRPVERTIVERCLEIALQAPTGSNSQGWQFVIVEDPAKKRALADIYARNFAKYAAMARSNTYQPGDLRYEQRDRITDSATYLTENFHRAPMLLVPCIEGQLDGVPAFAGASAWGSILPAVWSFMLALRMHGMGSAWTTIHLLDGGDAEAAELLGIPHDRYTQAGLFPIAYTLGTDFQPAKRLPLDTVLHWDRW
jgi:nitroreductase